MIQRWEGCGWTIAAVKRAFSSVLRDLSSIVTRSGAIPICDMNFRACSASVDDRPGERRSCRRYRRPAPADSAWPESRPPSAVRRPRRIRSPRGPRSPASSIAPPSTIIPSGGGRSGGGRGKRSSNGAINSMPTGKVAAATKMRIAVSARRAPEAGAPAIAEQARQSSAANNKRLIGDAIIQNIFETKKNT